MPIVTQPVLAAQDQNQDQNQEPSDAGQVSAQQHLNRLRVKLLALAEITYAAELSAFRTRVSEMSKGQLSRYTAEGFAETPDLLTILYFKALAERADALGLPAAQWQSVVDNKLEGL